MRNLSIETIGDGNIEPCRELCNELMVFQKFKAHLYPEQFDRMNFDTRMKKSYENALRSHVAIARDDGLPIGYVFSTIEHVEPSDRHAHPTWAPTGKDYIGFYPEWVALPQKIGCLNNLYLREGYRGCGLGAKLFEAAMEWLKGFSDVDLIFVYVSNGNDEALRFYLNHGFTYSHSVFGGFITAAYKRKS